jgi:hypothetical protein
MIISFRNSLDFEIDKDTTETKGMTNTNMDILIPMEVELHVIYHEIRPRLPVNLQCLYVMHPN